MQIKYFENEQFFSTKFSLNIFVNLIYMPQVSGDFIMLFDSNIALIFLLTFFDFKGNV